MKSVKMVGLVGVSAMSVAMALGGGGCQPTYRDVQRVPADQPVDVDYRFNDVDARQVWQKMSDDAQFRGWIDRWMAEHGGKRPTIIIGTIQNRTQDYIDTKVFTQNFSREMLNSGRVRVVAAKDYRGEIRDERIQGQEWNSPETRKAMKNELGADLILQGEILDIQTPSLNGRTVVKYFQTNFAFADIETNEEVWRGSVEIKKVSTDR